MNSTQSKSAISIDSDDENFVPPPPPTIDAEDSEDVDTDDSDDDDAPPPPPQESDDDVDEDDDDDDDDVDEDDDDDVDKSNFTGNALPQTSSVQQHVPNEIIDGSDLDDDSDNDENYLQKFDESLQQTIIADHHPEMKSHNYDEIINMATVTRNEYGAIIDPLHRSVPFITRYEKAKLIGERAAQLGAGASPFVEVDENMIDDYMISLKEFEEKKIPFIIKRPMPNGGCEYWRLEDLEILV
jgi:DNA-directed RNA polymerase I, II, and III subunit RPABC2